MAKHNGYFIIIFLFLVVLGASSCSNTRYLSDKESLYIGNKVKVSDTIATKAERKALESELSDIVRPKPNRTFLTMRLKLTVYNLAGEPKREYGIRHWLRNKVGEPPVLGSELNISQNTKLMVNYLQNRGYFNADAQGTKETKDQKTKAYFEVHTGAQYKIRQVAFPKAEDTSSRLIRDISTAAGNSLLKPGEPYNLETIKGERDRIDLGLKNKGYYYFNADYLFIEADTGVGDHRVDLTLKLKEDGMPRNAYNQYTINQVLILANYNLNNRNNRSTTPDSLRRTTRKVDTLDYGTFRLIDRQKLFRPSVFSQSMQLKPGDLYSLRNQNLALNRLVSLNAFKFVKNEFTPTRDTGNNKLNLTYLLTPYPRKSFNIDLSGFSQNDSRGGIRGSIGWRNRNFFKGAEQFIIKLTGGFEAQYGGQTQRPNSYNLGLESQLYVPRFMVPFFYIKPSGMYIPKTIFTAGYNYSLRIKSYQINALNVGFGYNWKEDAMKDHKLFPFNITLVRTDTLGSFDNLGSISLSNLIYNGFIFGPTYEYTYNSQLGNKTRKNHFYFSGLLDLAGNILGLAQGTSLNREPERIFGSQYAQYLKVQTDLRHYYHFSPNTILASRALLGYGYAYGNSAQLPNVKQFFSGGSSSLRGFGSRLVGPGSFDMLSSNNTFIEILGDIKAEASTELRAKLYRFIHGAAFMDMGNVWLLRDNPSFPGGTFSGNFYKEMAVDMGIGLRLDFSILILRFDVGIPIRKPWYPEGNRWVFNEISFGDNEWRGKNMFFNLAIGYPF